MSIKWMMTIPHLCVLFKKKPWVRSTHVFSPQDPYIFEPNCQMRVDEFGFFITWKSEGKVHFASDFAAWFLQRSLDQNIFVFSDFEFFEFLFKRRDQTDWNCSKLPGNEWFEMATEAVEAVCGYLPPLTLTVVTTMLLVCSAFGWKSPHSNVFACFPCLQEGQVLECSLINSIRVGAVPKVRTLAKKDILLLCLFAHCSRMERAASLLRGDASPPNGSRQTRQSRSLF